MKSEREERSVMITGNTLHSLSTRVCFVAGEDTTISAESIADQIHYLLGVLPSLLYLKIALQFPIITVLECPSCGISSPVISSQKCSFQLMQGTGVDDTFEKVLIDLLGKTLQNEKCLTQKQ